MSADTFLLIFKIVLIVFIGIPTLYALFFGAPFVPTPMGVVRNILKELKIKKGMTIYELGCGDGRFLTSASKEAAITAIGFEFSPLVWCLARIRNFLHRGKNVTIYLRDYWHHSLQSADVIFLYLLPQRLPRVIEKIQKECKPGTRIVSYAFAVKNLKPTKIIPKDPIDKFSPIYFYTL